MNALSDRVNTVDWRKVGEAAAGVLFFYFIVQRLWPSPAGVMVQGLVIGGLTALISFGIALVYRANRIVNFAQGDLGAVPASLAVLLIVGPGFPFFLALPIGIGAGIVLGAVIELLIIRRFFRAPRLNLTVVTIGISLALGVSGVLLPQAFDINIPPQSFPSPFDFSFAIGSTVFQGNDIIAMVAVPVCIAALTFLFRYTNVGIAIRASAENVDRTSLLGVPVGRINTIVWVIATVLATLAVFLRAGIVGLPIGQLLGPSILVRALAASVIGRMERLPTILVAALGLGVIESAIIFDTGRALLIDPILFVIITAALLLQRRGPQTREDEATSWQASYTPRPIPAELRGLPEVRYGRISVTIVLGILALTLPLFASTSQTSLAATVLITGIAAVSLVVLTGWAGQVSLGQVAFLGIGAAVGAFLTTRWHWDLAVAILAAGVVGAAAAMVIGLPALRIRGLFLGVTTLSFALATSSFFLNEEFVTWLPTLRFERPFLLKRISLASEERYYYFALAALVLAASVAMALRRSRTGRVLIAVRENDRAARTYGVNPTAARLVAFAISGFLAAFAGAVFVHHQQVLGVQAYSVGRSFLVFTMVVVGGLGSIAGALLGVFLIQGIGYFGSVFPDAIQQVLNFLTGGVGVIVILLIFRGGLGQALYSIRDRALRAVAERHGLVVPSLVADTREGADHPDRRAMDEAEFEKMLAGDGLGVP